MEGLYHNVSLRLCDVLDWIGASEQMRAMSMELARAREVKVGILRSLIFGSSYEGTSTIGLDSDVDELYYLPIDLVIERLCDAQPYWLSFLMVTDNSTKPGYVKLQVVYNGVRQTIFDRGANIIEEIDLNGKICQKGLSQLYLDYFSVMSRVFAPERNGPALTTLSGTSSMDSVIAYLYPHIPSFARSWISRERLYNWPHPEHINKMKDFGCFLVSVNHPSSQNGPIEHRLSFSLQERFLMSGLNPTQHKIYILLKMIKKDIIHNQVPNSINSYHCKTCLFYAIENTPGIFWTRGKLLECLLLCVKLLLDWVRQQNCPNYFIPEENMFDRLECTTLQNVQAVLEGIVENWCSFLWNITCDNVGKLLHEVLFGCGPGILRMSNEGVALRAFTKCIVCFYRPNGLKFLLRVPLCHTAAHALTTLHAQRNDAFKFKQFNYSREYELEGDETSFTYMDPYFALRMSQCLASMMLTNKENGLTKILFDAFVYNIAKSGECDVLSTPLVVASYFLQSNRLEMCDTVLRGCETSLGSHVISVCDCRDNEDIVSSTIQDLVQVQLQKMEQLPFKTIIKTYLTGCITFPPYVTNLVSPALQFEMYRITSPNSRKPLLDALADALFDWFDCIVVDSKVYLFFLQYVMYSKTNRPIKKQDALENLVRVINTERGLGHRETAYNLLGWIYRQENQLQEALKCFRESWKIRPHHNAAKWHMLLLLQQLHMQERGGETN